MSTDDEARGLPVGSAPPPVPIPHFPSRLHAFVWRNWGLVPMERLAEVVGSTPDDLLRLGHSMGLSGPPLVDAEQQRRSHITVIKRNWHLLPYPQLLQLLDWTAGKLEYVLREDDFLFIKLGSLKPHCEPLTYAPPDEEARSRAEEIAATLRAELGEGTHPPEDMDLFGFVRELSRPPGEPSHAAGESRFSPRFCYSYFALYGDPLLAPEADAYPDGYLARLAGSGVDGIWLQGVLYKLFPFPWDPALSSRYEERLANLRTLVARARRHGIGVYLYLNEPRALPHAFFAGHPELKGAAEIDLAAMCTSRPEVQQYLAEAVESIARAVPDLAGFFTISASENLTHCWSHHRGADCPRCGERSAAEVIAEVNARIHEGIRQSGSAAELIVWDWGWADADAEAIIRALPAGVALMSVSEWSLPLQRGGTESVVGEYSISAIGPGPRALRHWEIARERGLKTLAKIQANNTWELSSVPYIPAVANVARHAANLREVGVGGLMLGWTLGGYPSPNLEVVAELGRDPSATPEEAMMAVARRRYGEAVAPWVVYAWEHWSRAFSEFPYHVGVVYKAPLQLGPANLLWEAPTGYRATMVGFPYDDLDGWRSVYPPEVFAEQMERIAIGFVGESLTASLAMRELCGGEEGAERLREEVMFAEVAGIHFQSVANQARFVTARTALAEARTASEAAALCEGLERILEDELGWARRLYGIRDSRIGFEASNQYYYVPLDLAEKVLNCRDLLDRWLPAERVKWGL